MRLSKSDLLKKSQIFMEKMKLFIANYFSSQPFQMNGVTMAMYWEYLQEKSLIEELFTLSNEFPGFTLFT